MTEEQYNYYADRLSKANELKTNIIDAERVLRDIEFNGNIKIIFGCGNVHQYLSIEEINAIKKIIASHFQQVLEDNKKKLEDL